MSIHVGLHVKWPLFLADFYQTLNVSRDFREIFLPNFMKIRPVGAESSHADGRTDTHDEAHSYFPQFCEGKDKS